MEDGTRVLEDARATLQAWPQSTDDLQGRVVARSNLLEQIGNPLQAIPDEQAAARARDFCLRMGVQQPVSFTVSLGHGACGV